MPIRFCYLLFEKFCGQLSAAEAERVYVRLPKYEKVASRVSISMHASEPLLPPILSPAAPTSIGEPLAAVVLLHLKSAGEKRKAYSQPFLLVTFGPLSN